MAYEIPGQTVTIPASADLSASQYCFVTIDSAGEAALPVSSTVPPFGVLQNKPTVQGQAASVMINGLSKVVAAGSTVSVGDLISASSLGRAIAASGFVAGRVVSGSSGSTGRVLTVNIEQLGSTA